MKIFISGATGFIGSRLALRLANEGHQVHALYRDESKKTSIQHPNIQLFKGDILDYKSLIQAMEGCEQIYNAAAFARVWDKDYSSIYRLNIEGTMNVVKAGIHSGVKKFVCTSTAGVLGPSLPGQVVDENTPRPSQYFIDYECSKKIMEEVLSTFSLTGIEIVVVNPSRVYGPGVLSDSNGITRIIQRYIRGKWRIIPGNGKSIGNYVFVDDVVSGHIQAMEKGRSGERYILGGTNMTYNQLFAVLAELTGKKYHMIHVPLSICQMISGLMLFIAQVSCGTPLITPALIRKYNHNWNISSSKAEHELDYKPVDFKTGVNFTINWLKKLNSL
ncbi:MAG: NAD-dependent epimerase/dehydratase family protein [Prolixibacteraceae bacterium]|nr:NAD-dependent epimerase/dehydratase family protein [Prolixibacteraceae bacterium]